MSQTKTIQIILFYVHFWINVRAQEDIKKTSVFRDSLDHAYDMSDWLLKKQGFLLIPVPITEPAFGYGAVAAAVCFSLLLLGKEWSPFHDRRHWRRYRERNMDGRGLFHAGYWMQDRIRYTGVIAGAYLNVGFYGTGNLNLLIMNL